PASPAIYTLSLHDALPISPSLAPSIGVLLNLSPDHLDRHGPADDAEAAMRNYAAIKERLVIGAEVAVVGVDDEPSVAILKRRVADRKSTRLNSSHVKISYA